MLGRGRRAPADPFRPPSPRADHALLRLFRSATPEAVTTVDIRELPSGALQVGIEGRRVEVDAEQVGPSLSIRVDGRVVDLTTEGAPPELGAIRQRPPLVRAGRDDASAPRRAPSVRRRRRRQDPQGADARNTSCACSRSLATP